MSKRSNTESWPVERQAFSIPEFCGAFGVSRGTVYNMWRDGTGPKSFKVRGRTLISITAAEAWRARLEQEAA